MQETLEKQTTRVLTSKKQEKIKGKALEQVKV